MNNQVQNLPRTSASWRVSQALPGILRLYLTLAFPPLLLLVCARIVMSPAFLYFEYTRPGFPDDPYGLTKEDRLNYAPFAIEYLLNDAGISYLGDLTFPDDMPLFNMRELRHMRDVKILTQISFGFAGAAGALALLALAALARTPQGRSYLRMALFRGSILTLAIISTVVIVAVLNWDFFFVTFHALFFENDTWYFAYSDTLIRLFPEQFWFDAALAVGGLAAITSLTVLFVTSRPGRSA